MVFRRCYFLLLLLSSLEKSVLSNIGTFKPFSNVNANRSSSWAGLKYIGYGILGQF